MRLLGADRLPVSERAHQGGPSVPVRQARSRKALHVKPPKLCYHVDISAALDKDEPVLDPYSLRVDCVACRKVAIWISAVFKAAQKTSTA